MPAKQKNTYDTNYVIQLSVLVDNLQGFIKSGYGYYDHQAQVEVRDNKTVIMQYLSGAVDVPEITQDVITTASEISDLFRNELIGKKLMQKISSFEDSLLTVLSADAVDSFGISLLASLPNSARIEKKRRDLDDWFDSHRATSEHVGKINDRLSFVAYVRDVKFIVKYGIHLVTCIDDNGNIVKFFFNREPDIGGILEGKKIKLTGKVKTHDVSKFSNCKETVFNYVKISDL